MPATKHFGLELMPTGAADWPVVINSFLARIEQGHTLYTAAFETITIGSPFYINAGGSAVKASSGTAQQGLWQSSSTAAGASGYGQFEGVLTKSAWGLTTGSYYYADSPGTLISTQPGSNRAIGFAISPTEMIIHPFKRD